MEATTPQLSQMKRECPSPSRGFSTADGGEGQNEPKIHLAGLHLPTCCMTPKINGSLSGKLREVLTPVSLVLRPRESDCGPRKPTCLTLATSLMKASSSTSDSSFFSWLRSVRKPSPILWVKRIHVFCSPCFSHHKACPSICHPSPYFSWDLPALLGPPTRSSQTHNHSANRTQQTHKPCQHLLFETPYHG